MAETTLRIIATPRRILSEREAADYCGYPLSKFKLFCPVVPVQFPGGSKRYDMRDLDAWVDGCKQPNVAHTHDDILSRLG
jgi:hypothetical protein